MLHFYIRTYLHSFPISVQKNIYRIPFHIISDLRLIQSSGYLMRESMFQYSDMVIASLLSADCVTAVAFPVSSTPPVAPLHSSHVLWLVRRRHGRGAIVPYRYRLLPTADSLLSMKTPDRLPTKQPRPLQSLLKKKLAEDGDTITRTRQTSPRSHRQGLQNRQQTGVILFFMYTHVPIPSGIKHNEAYRRNLTRRNSDDLKSVI